MCEGDGIMGSEERRGLGLSGVVEGERVVGPTCDKRSDDTSRSSSSPSPWKGRGKGGVPSKIVYG